MYADRNGYVDHGIAKFNEHYGSAAEAYGLPAVQDAAVMIPEVSIPTELPAVPAELSIDSLSTRVAAGLEKARELMAEYVPALGGDVTKESGEALSKFGDQGESVLGIASGVWVACGIAAGTLSVYVAVRYGDTIKAVASDTLVGELGAPFAAAACQLEAFWITCAPLCQSDVHTTRLSRVFDDGTLYRWSRLGRGPRSR